MIGVGAEVRGDPGTVGMAEWAPEGGALGIGVPVESGACVGGWEGVGRTVGVA